MQTELSKVALGSYLCQILLKGIFTSTHETTFSLYESFLLLDLKFKEVRPEGPETPNNKANGQHSFSFQELIQKCCFQPRRAVESNLPEDE